jgi:hypothetical protein
LPGVPRAYLMDLAVARLVAGVKFPPKPPVLGN